jgi:hypothetical protein
VTHLRLAGVTRLTLGGNGPKDAYLFDPHRLALPSWALALEGGPAALLVTLDRHLDLVPPAEPGAVPGREAGLRAIDEYARWSLDVRNVDHVIAAMEAGLVTDAIVIARARPVGAIDSRVWRDRRGTEHRLLVARTVDQISAEFGTERASPEGREAEELLRGAARTLLDVDLDCFTSPSDADPTTVIPWPEELIREHLLPRGSERFWSAVLERCAALTFAREPAHCGGVVASGRLFESVAKVLFEEVLETEVP